MAVKEKIQTRMESDSIGVKEVPVEAYYGVQSLRAMENFSITGTRMHTEMINSLARLKKACAMANAAAGVIDERIATAVTNCIDGITANEERCHELLDSSVGMITALCPHIGYAKAAELAKKALVKRVPVRTLLLEREIMTATEQDTVLDAYGMTQPGISGKELIKV